MLLLLLLVVVVPLASPSPSGPNEGLVVRVEQGALRGHRIERPASSALRSFYAFEGVPYARPPTGSRRFKDPEPPQPWTGVRNATAVGTICLQRVIDTGEITGEEDCLYLNIYTADPPAMWATVKRPVILFIHGGAFVAGTGNPVIARPDPILRQQVIYVAMNHRLGVLGFLNTEDSQAPGNAGLKDQSLALRWVQRNIASFGGDPTKITLMGESAGAAAVQYHMLSPLSRGRFQRAVSVSGSVLPVWALVERPRRVAVGLRALFDAACPGDASDAIVACLQRVDARELVTNQFNLTIEESQSFFGRNYQVPSIEARGSSQAPFLPADPEKLLREGRFEKVPHINGFTSEDGMIYLGFGGLLADPSRWQIVDERFEELFLWDLPFGLRTREAARAARQFYFGDRSLRDADQNPDTLRRAVQFFTDIFFSVGSVTTAKIMSERGAPVYVYQFSRDGPLYYWKEVLNALSIPGVTHGDDMVYVFDFVNQTTGEPLTVPASEQPIRDRQVKIFTDFAKTGNPTPSGAVRWPRFDARRERFLDMGERLEVRERALGERIAFWRALAANSTRGGSGPQ